MATKGMIIKRILKETDKWTIEELMYWRLKDLENYLRYLKFKKAKDKEEWIKVGLVGEDFSVLQNSNGK